MSSNAFILFISLYYYTFTISLLEMSWWGLLFGNISCQYPGKLLRVDYLKGVCQDFNFLFIYLLYMCQLRSTYWLVGWLRTWYLYIYVYIYICIYVYNEIREEIGKNTIYVFTEFTLRSSQLLHKSMTCYTNFYWRYTYNTTITDQ